jgi:hypothetical protein
MKARGKNQKRLLVTVLFVAVLLVAKSVLFPSAEPMYKEKPVRVWVDEACDVGNSESEHEVEMLGRVAIPYLIEKLGVEDSNYQIARENLWQRLAAPLKRVIPYHATAEFTRFKAARFLGKLGPSAAPAVPALLKLVEDPGSLVPEEALKTLSAIGPSAGVALPLLTQRLTNQPDPALRMNIAVAILKIGGDTNVALQVLTNTFMAQMRVPNLLYHERVMAALALSRAGPFAREMVPVLHSLWSKETNATARVWMAMPIWSIGGDTNILLNVITNTLLSDDESESSSARSGFSAAPEVAELAMPLLLSLQFDPSKRPHVRTNAAEILRRVRSTNAQY